MKILRTRQELYIKNNTFKERKKRNGPFKGEIEVD